MAWNFVNDKSIYLQLVDIIQKMKRETARETIQTFLQQMKNMGFEKEEIIDLIREDKEGACHEQ